MVGSRRIERSFTEESFATTFSTPTLAENSKADLKALISSESPEYVSGAMPALIKSLNNEIGIPKGDIVISLLNNNLSEPGSWSNRVDEAIWRCRTMRRHLSNTWQEKKALRKSQTNLLSVRIDVDDVRVVGGIDKIAGTQETALNHLEYDDLDDALTLCESINLSCETFVEEMQPDQAEKCKACVASTFHNLGIVYMLRGEFDDALPCFEQATFLFAEYHGPGHMDHVVSNRGVFDTRYGTAKANACFSLRHHLLSCQCVASRWRTIPKPTAICMTLSPYPVQLPKAYPTIDSLQRSSTISVVCPIWEESLRKRWSSSGKPIKSR